MTRTLVTGGSGFIGQYLVANLAAQGDEVRILDKRPPRAERPEVEFVRGSITDAALVREAMSGIDRVYHLAALPGMWISDRSDFHTVNCVGTQTVLAAARERNVSRFLHCSTESILFGRTKNEAAALNDMPGVYTRSKMAAELLALSAAAEGFPVVIVNPTLPIGPGDFNVTPPAAMLRHFLHRRIHFYTDFMLNLVDVRDVALGMILAMERGQIGHRYLLGGENLPLTTLLDRMAAITGKKCPRWRIPGAVALAVAVVAEQIANRRTHRPPVATAEGVRIARRAHALAIEKSRHEIAYAPRPIEPALREAIDALVKPP